MKKDIEIKPILNIDIDKYIDWYEDECQKSEIARWENRQLGIIHFLRNQTNFDCKTYINKEKALYYKNRINKKYSEKVKQLNDKRQPIYYPNEWLVISWSQWESFDNAIKENPHIIELERLLNLCKNDLKAKKVIIKRFYKKIKKDKIKNLKAIKNGKFIQLDFYDKGRYFANENPSYMAYCKEQSFFRLIHDYLRIKAIDYAVNLFKNLSENKAITEIKVLTLKPKFTDLNYQIKQLQKSTQPLFNSTVQQWENLFSNEIKPFEPPIELKKSTKLVTLREFINMLIECNLISKRGALTTIAKAKAFIYDNRIVTFNQLNDASKTISNDFHIKDDTIEVIKKALKVD